MRNMEVGVSWLLIKEERTGRCNWNKFECLLWRKTFLNFTHIPVYFFWWSAFECSPIFKSTISWFPWQPREKKRTSAVATSAMKVYSVCRKLFFWDIYLVVDLSSWSKKERLNVDMYFTLFKSSRFCLYQHKQCILRGTLSMKLTNHK